MKFTIYSALAAVCAHEGHDSHDTIDDPDSNHGKEPGDQCDQGDRCVAGYCCGEAVEINPNSIRQVAISICWENCATSYPEFPATSNNPDGDNTFSCYPNVAED